jgi:hypothetical protein
LEREKIMGGRGARSSISSIAQSHTGVTMTGSGLGASNITYGTFDDNDAQKLRDDMEDIYDPDVTDAIKLYISNSNPNGDGFSHSQNLNYKLDNGMALNPTEKYIDDNIQAGMHAIGKNSNLVRYCHDDILRSVGINDYTKMSDSQLQSALVGKAFKTTSYMSTSYDGKKNPFNPSASQGGGREVVMKIKAGKDTKMVFGAKAQAEIVLDKGTNFKITGIKYDGSYATPRNSGRKPRIELEVETF